MSSSNHTTALCALLLLLLAVSSAAGQGTLTIDLGVPSPSSFDTVGGAVAGQNVLVDAAVNLVRTESMVLTLVTTPTPKVPLSAQLQPRRLQLWVAAEAAPPLNLGFGNIYLAFAGGVTPVALFDSFSNMFHPTFGPGLGDVTNTLNVPIFAEFFHPSYAFPLPPLLFQAIAEDTPGNGLLLSGAVRVTLIDPATEPDPANPGLTFAPTITDINPKALSGLGILRPSGPEAGLNIVTITGTNFLAQSDWVFRPPTIMFGTQAATEVTLLSNTTLTCRVPPVPFPTAPPLTSACLVDVSFQNDPYISPAGVSTNAPMQYLYLTPNPPAITNLNTNNGDPEGLEPRFIDGSWFLAPGIIVRMTSVAEPSLTTDLVTPPVSVLGPGNVISYITPPFCTGPVTVQVINCDEQISNLETFTYNPKPPVYVSAAPTFTTAPELLPLTVPAILDTGSLLTITGDKFITLNSTLNGSSTVNPTLFRRTKVFIDGIEQCPPPIYPATAWPLPPIPSDIFMTPVTIACPTLNNDQIGPIRTGLGYKTLRLENPPCVNVGNVDPIAIEIPQEILVQDALPPSLTSIYPAIGPNTGDTVICIKGTNFFKITPGTTVPDDYTQDFTPFGNIAGDITSLDPRIIEVPAVSFGGVFSPLVTLEDDGTLQVVLPKLPGSPVGTIDLPVTIYNPDSRQSSSGITFTFVPPLVDGSSLLTAAMENLDAAALVQITQMPGGLQVSVNPSDPPAIEFIVNPNPSMDQTRDVHDFAGQTPAVSYDYCFLFNTRIDGTTARHFTFRNVNLPETITLPASTIVPRRLFDPVQPGGIVDETASAGTEVRVIFKAFGYTRDGDVPTGRIRVNATDSSNYPLVLGSVRNMTIGAMIQLGGDAFHISDMEQGQSQANPFRVQVNRVLPAAGAGRGGRGGIDFSEELTVIAAPNFAAGAGVLSGGAGEIPTGRAALLGGIGSSGGSAGGAVGSGPVAFFVGAGGGAGYTEPGTSGASGSSVGGVGGPIYGNATTPFAAPPGFGLPAFNRDIFGQTALDMDSFAAKAAISTGLLGGGGGGGGGGGATAIIAAQICMGGRGGDGGGTLVALTNSVLTLTEGAAILAYGDHGYPGILQFPIPNQPPFNNLSVGGEGGAGAGGTVLGLAIAQCCFEVLVSAAFCDCSGLAPTVSFSPVNPQVDVRGGVAGNAPGFGLTIPGKPGGGGGNGRIRFAVNAQSPYIADIPGVPLLSGFQSALLAMFGNPCGVPPGSLPSAMTLPLVGSSQALMVPAPEGFSDCLFPIAAGSELASYFGYPAP